MSEKNEFAQVLGAKVENWQNAKSPSKTSMHGHYCIVEPIDIDTHAKKLFEALQIDNQGESWTYLPYGPFNALGEFKDWLTSTQAEPGTFLYAILDAQSHQPIGIAGYLRTNPEHGSIEVGHLHFSALLKKKPAATEAMYLMMKYAFETLGYRRYEWKCNSLNKPSWNAALRLGFTFEGLFRQSHVLKGRNRDTAWFSIIDSEWPQIKEKFEKWLSPDNFDQNGNQLLSMRDI